MTAAVPVPGTEPAPDPDAWSRDPDTLERLFHNFIKAGDAKGVESALLLMVAVDPARAVRLHDDMRDALVVANFLRGAR